jgi:hypothetical protein
MVLANPINKQEVFNQKAALFNASIACPMLWKLPCHEKFHGLKKNEVPVKVAVVPNKF